MTIIWMTNSFCYYLISYQQKYLNGNLFVNISLSSIAEPIAYLSSGYLRHKTSLKVVFVFAYIISSLGMILLTFVDTSSVSLLAFFILLSKYGLAFSMNMEYIANVQLFPITIVGTSFGITNFFARSLTIFAPYAAEIKPLEISQFIYFVLNLSALIAAVFIKSNQNTK